MTEAPPRLALDTNVVLRYLVRDDAGQAERARRLIESKREEVDRLFISWIVLCELAWVLHRTYGYPRRAVGLVVRGLLESREVVVENEDAAGRALASYFAGRGGYADYLIREAAQRARCASVATFDTDLLPEPGFREP